jgi:hypothetical protein
LLASEASRQDQHVVFGPLKHHFTGEEHLEEKENGGVIFTINEGLEYNSLRIWNRSSINKVQVVPYSI